MIEIERHQMFFVAAVNAPLLLPLVKQCVHCVAASSVPGLGSLFVFLFVGFVMPTCVVRMGASPFRFVRTHLFFGLRQRESLEMGRVGAQSLCPCVAARHPMAAPVGWQSVLQSIVLRLLAGQRDGDDVDRVVGSEDVADDDAGDERQKEVDHTTPMRRFGSGFAQFER